MFPRHTNSTDIGGVEGRCEAIFAHRVSLFLHMMVRPTESEVCQN